MVGLVNSDSTNDASGTGSHTAGDEGSLPTVKGAGGLEEGRDQSGSTARNQSGHSHQYGMAIELFLGAFECPSTGSHTSHDGGHDSSKNSCRAGTKEAVLKCS